MLRAAIFVAFSCVGDGFSQFGFGGGFWGECEVVEWRIEEIFVICVGFYVLSVEFMHGFDVVVLWFLLRGFFFAGLVFDFWVCLVFCAVDRTLGCWQLLLEFL